MVKINRIYTKTGDHGETGLVGGKRVSKAALRIDACGDIDELNSWLGLIRTLLGNKKNKLAQQIAKIQNELFDLGAELATPSDYKKKSFKAINSASIRALELGIDKIIAKLPELKSFVLPGGSITNAYLHLARSVCRRAERKIVKLAQQEKVSQNILIYINRLSDLLFAMARNEVSRTKEFLWKPGL